MPKKLTETQSDRFGAPRSRRPGENLGAIPSRVVHPCGLVRHLTGATVGLREGARHGSRDVQRSSSNFLQQKKQSPKICMGVCQRWWVYLKMGGALPLVASLELPLKRYRASKNNTNLQFDGMCNVDSKVSTNGWKIPRLAVQSPLIPVKTARICVFPLDCEKYSHATCGYLKIGDPENVV